MQNGSQRLGVKQKWQLSFHYPGVTSSKPSFKVSCPTSQHTTE